MKNKRGVTDDEVTAGPLCIWDLPMSHGDGDFFFKEIYRSTDSVRRK